MTNFSALRLDYEAGQISLDYLVKKYDITKEQLLKKAAAEKWKRGEPNRTPWHKNLPVITVEEVTDAIYDKTPIEEMFDEDDLQKRQLLSSVFIGQKHRSFIERMQDDLQKQMRKAMEDISRAPALPLGGTYNEMRAAANISHELYRGYQTPARLLLDTIEAERTLYNLSKKDITDEPDKIADQQKQILRDVQDQLHDLMTAKSAFTESKELSTILNEDD